MKNDDDHNFPAELVKCDADGEELEEGRCRAGRR